MKITAVVGDIQSQETPAIAICLVEGSAPPFERGLSAIDDALSGSLSTILEEGDFRGKRNEVLVLYNTGQLSPKRLLVVGLGEPDELTLNSLREAAATSVKKARALGLSKLHLTVDEGSGGFSIDQKLEAMTEGALLGLYRFTELKTQNGSRRPDPEELVFIIPDHADLSATRAAIRRGRAVAEATVTARDLVNRPANIATPSAMAEAAQAIAARTGLTCAVLDKATLASLGMNLLLSVNQGGNEPARLIVLEHNADQPDLPTVVLVGKGITFDTGGISLKSSQGMERMKGDMGGAAAVLGTLQAVAELDLPLHVVGLAPVTENLPDAQATKPGDVQRSLKGLTVEIINTDAEGRLILADSLTYAGEYAPDAILDIATLTGGRIVALGDHAAAVMGDAALIERLRSAGDATGERVWPLPLFKEYGKQLESEVADLKNVGGRAASSITAGFFLSKFVPDSVPWVHIDIAGLAIKDKANAYVPKGGTGFGVRLLLETLRNWS